MRTTVNLDEHLLAEAKVRAARSNRPLGDIIDDALRRQFAVSEQPDSAIVLPVYGAREGRPLVDIDDRDAVAEALGDNMNSPWTGPPDADR